MQSGSARPPGSWPRAARSARTLRRAISLSHRRTPAISSRSSSSTIMHDLDYTFPAVLWGGNALMQRQLHLAAIALALMANSLPALGQSFAEIYARESAENWRETMEAYAADTKNGHYQSAKRLGEIHA